MQNQTEFNRRDFIKLAGPASLAAASGVPSPAAAAEPTGPKVSPPPPVPPLTEEQLRRGANLLVYEDYSAVDPLPLVKKYDGLRVTDVLDALQAIGLQDIGVMDHSIRPLWRDTTDRLAHRIYGVAVTYQYLPTNKPQAPPMSYAEFKKWHAAWYRDYAPELFSKILRPGTVVVIDAQGIENTGFVGSNNALGWKSRGMAGVVTNGCCRDTDEIILERIPVYSKFQGGGTRPGRIESGAINRPVTVGGVLVRPQDVVVADGDGVVVVPREQAEQVATIAWDIAGGDKIGRKKIYDNMGLKPDATIQ
jgi:regulator of RNase E activity RraA